MWSYNYNQSYISHASGKFKYIKKEKRPSYTRYYYAGTGSSRTRKGRPEPETDDNYDGPVGTYTLDEEDQKFLEDRRAGKDTRTVEEYQADKRKKKSAETAQAKAEKEAKEKAEKEAVEKAYFEENEDEIKKRRRKELASVGKKVLNYYW